MNLDTVDKSLEIILGEAKTTTDCDITASYADNTQYNFLLVENDAVSNGTTAVTVVAAPAFDTQRQVKEIRLHNNDTVQHQVTLRLNNAGTIRIMETASVAPGGDFLYTPDAPAVVSTGAPAVLLESGTTGKKISAMSAGASPPAAAGSMVPVVVPGDATNYRLPLTTLLTGANGTALVQGEGFTITTGADGASGAQGAGSILLRTGADVSGGSAGVFSVRTGNDAAGGGAGRVTLITGDDAVGGGAGAISLLTGAGNTTGVHGGSISLATGAAQVGDANGGDINLILGTGVGTGRRGLCVITGVGLAAVDPSVSNAIWASNGRLVQSGAIIDPVTSTVTSGAAVALTTGTAKDVTTISVPAGNWTISGAVYFTGNAATTVTLVQGSVGTMADTLDTTPGQIDTEYLAAATIATLAADPALPGLSADVTLGSPTTYRLDAKATFAINTLSAYGTIRAVPRA